MAIIKIKNLLLRTFIGFNPDEKKNKQDVIINVWLKTDATKALKTDHADDAVNYRTICKNIIDHVQGSRYDLLESLTRGILDIVMKEKHVLWAKVEVDKPHALRFTDSVSVELEESRE